MREVVVSYRFTVDDETTNDDLGSLVGDGFAQFDDAMVPTDTQGNQKRIPTSGLESTLEVDGEILL